MLSVGVTVNVTVPELLGVPLRLIVPVPSPEIVRPVEFVTADNANVTAPVPRIVHPPDRGPRADGGSARARARRRRGADVGVVSVRSVNR